jgi:hypothetical protein
LALLILLPVVALVLSLVALSGRPAPAAGDARMSPETPMARNVGTITDKTGKRAPESIVVDV